MTLKVAHAVTDDGGVYCTQQKRVVDVITCYACEKLVEIDLDSRRPKVVCTVTAPGEAAAV